MSEVEVDMWFLILRHSCCSFEFDVCLDGVFGNFVVRLYVCLSLIHKDLSGAIYILI